jgi:hypothetical protein
MKISVGVVPAVAALVLAGLAAGPSAAASTRRGGSPSPAVVSSSRDQLIIRTDDHGHRMTFEVAPGASVPDGLRRGVHVNITYHPLGSTGQAVDEVQLIEGAARNQASFRSCSSQGEPGDRAVRAATSLP